MEVWFRLAGAALGLIMVDDDANTLDYKIFAGDLVSETEQYIEPGIFTLDSKFMKYIQSTVDNKTFWEEHAREYLDDESINVTVKDDRITSEIRQLLPVESMIIQEQVTRKISRLETSNNTGLFLTVERNWKTGWLMHGYLGIYYNGTIFEEIELRNITSHMTGFPVLYPVTGLITAVMAKITKDEISE